MSRLGEYESEHQQWGHFADNEVSSIEVLGPSDCRATLYQDGHLCGESITFAPGFYNAGYQNADGQTFTDDAASSLKGTAEQLM